MTSRAKRSSIVALASLATAVLTIAGGVAAAPKFRSQAAAVETDGPSRSTETATVTRRDLAESVEVNATIGFGSPQSLPIEASGLVTSAPETGDIVNPGDELVRIEDKPVVAAEGEIPLYRDLRRTSPGERDEAGEKLGPLTGQDVEQLQRFLLEHGLTGALDGESEEDLDALAKLRNNLEADGVFGKSTETAVKAWQKRSGHAATGTVTRRQLVFVARSVRIEATPAVGTAFNELTVTSTAAKVTLDISAKQKRHFPVDKTVEISSVDGSSFGVVSLRKSTIGNDGSKRFEVEIELDDPQALGEAEVAEATSTTTIAEDVLTVPVRALLALAEGGWAVQVSTTNGAQLTAVDLGKVVDGFAEITGVDEGTDVVVPV